MMIFLTVVGMLLALIFGLLTVVTALTASTIMIQIFSALMALGFVLSLILIAIAGGVDKLDSTLRERTAPPP